MADLIRSGRTLTPAQRLLHEGAITDVLIELHNELDDAVSEAYGWPKGMPGNEILDRLVSLNKERTLEEAKGHIRYLRPEYQSNIGM
jgi:Mg/Co/Ni transporter MgtE